MPFDDQEELIFVFMMVPNKFPFELGHLHMEIVDLPHQLGAPEVAECSKLLGQYNLLHASS